MKIDYLNKFKGALIGLAIGDILGSPFNGEIRLDILSKFENFETFLWKNKRKIFKTYTDNTQLSLHVTEALIQGNGFKMNYLIREFIKWLDDPPGTNAFSCISSISKLKNNISWKNVATNSGGSGTLTRTTPIALLYNNDEDNLNNLAELISSITHSHPAASGSSILLARAISFLLKKSPSNQFLLDEFFELLILSILNSQKEVWNDLISYIEELRISLDLSIEAGLIKFSQIGVSQIYYIQEYLGKAFIHPYAISTIICVLFLFLKHLDSFDDFIYIISTAGGGATAAAVGGAIAGAFHGYSRIPEKLIKLVKNSKYILDVAERLYKTYRRRNKIK
ncbi:MAG: hypothetical protein EU541_04460 [Promethearchaeota archaeon]|nr:MAG: hypothetical protein EU541_04460 [Candidatus Lokiarchaeota archaeon]